MRDYGYSRAKAVQETRYVNEQIRLATQIAQGDLSGIAPKGRAPRGLGEGEAGDEYQREGEGT
jgi:hypothetical protein